jgi:hypothetical protein
LATLIPGPYEAHGHWVSSARNASDGGRAWGVELDLQPVLQHDPERVARLDAEVLLLRQEDALDPQQSGRFGRDATRLDPHDD